MAFSLIAHVGAGSTNSTSVTTGQIDTTGADFIGLVLAQYNAAVISTISDSKSNTWNQLTPAPDSTFSRMTLFDVTNATVGTSHTFTATNAGSAYMAIAVAAFSGSDTTAPLDQQNSAQVSPGTSLQTGSITPSSNNELIIAGIAFSVTNTMSIDSGFTITDQIQYSVGNHFGVGMAYLIQTAAAAVNPTWSWNTSIDASAAIASFLSGGGGGGGSFFYRRRVQ